MSSSPPTRTSSHSVSAQDEDHSKTVKLSATELRQQLQELGVDLEPDEARDRAGDEQSVQSNERRP